MSDFPIKLEYYPTLNKELINKAVKKIEKNRDHWQDPFFMDVYDHADLKHFKKVCSPYIQDSKLKNLIIIGTGGSFQTMKALSGFSEKKIHFLTSSRPKELSKVLSTTYPEDSLVIPISRGGKTLDVNSTISLFKDYKMLALSSQGPMNTLVKKLNATILPVPDLSGRFAASICSVVYVPMLLAGISVDDFQKGLEDGYNIFKNVNDNVKNIALQFASFLEQLYLKGYRNIFSLPYSKWLEGLTGLFVQEISESSGKANMGMMGTYQAAPVCQHSVLEFLLGGSKGYVSPLLWTTLTEPTDVEMDNFNDSLKGKTGLSVINYQLDATFQALIEQKIPGAKISLKNVTPYTFGVMISFIQSLVYYFCLLLDVNWSSNPMVNVGKKICNEALIKNLNLKARIKVRKNLAKDIFDNFF